MLTYEFKSPFWGRPVPGAEIRVDFGRFLRVEKISDWKLTTICAIDALYELSRFLPSLCELPLTKRDTQRGIYRGRDLMNYT